MINGFQLFRASSQPCKTHFLQKFTNHNGVEADDDKKREEVAKDKEANLCSKKSFNSENLKNMEMVPSEIFPPQQISNVCKLLQKSASSKPVKGEFVTFRLSLSLLQERER